MRLAGRAHCAGFTLLEVLAVVALLSMVTAALTVHLASVSESARFRAAEARLLDLDARARLLARSATTVLLAVADGGRALTLSEVRTGAPLARVDLDEGASVTLEVEPNQSWVLIDRLGRSVDYELELQSGEQKSRWSIAGGSGWTETVETEEEGR